MEETLMEERKQMPADPDEGSDICSDEIKKNSRCFSGFRRSRAKDLGRGLKMKLVASGKVGISKKGKYARSEVFAQTGIFSAHHRGFGFVTIEGRDGDLFVPPDDIRGRDGRGYGPGHY